MKNSVPELGASSIKQSPKPLKNAPEYMYLDGLGQACTVAINADEG